MTRPRHPKPDVERAVRYAETLGWRWRAMDHWGRLFCTHADRDGCQVGVNGTPRNAAHHARQIVQAVNRCPHGQERLQERPPGDPDQGSSDQGGPES